MFWNACVIALVTAGATGDTEPKRVYVAPTTVENESGAPVARVVATVLGAELSRDGNRRIVGQPVEQGACGTLACALVEASRVEADEVVVSTLARADPGWLLTMTRHSKTG